MATGIAIGAGAFVATGGLSLPAKTSFIVGAVTAGVSGFYGMQALAEPCQDFADGVVNNLQNMQSGDPEAYYQYVQDWCNGQPNACLSGNLSIGNPLSELTPGQCAQGPLHVDCALSLINMTRPTGNSVNDIIGSLAFINISAGSNYWQTQNYGYLIGIYTHDPDPPGHQNPQ